MKVLSSKVGEKNKADRLHKPARTILLIRGVWCQVRVDATECGHAFEDYTELDHIRTRNRSIGQLTVSTKWSCGRKQKGPDP